MRYLVNPLRSVTYHGKPASQAKWAASGFRRNPKRKLPKRTKFSKRQLAAQRKFAAMARARSKAVKRTLAKPRYTNPTGEVTMARRKRKAAHRRKTGRRVGRARSRSRRTVYAANPRRRSRKRSSSRRRVSHRRYRRNPGLSLGGVGGTLKKVGIGVVSVLGGMAVGNYISINVTPKIFTPAATDTTTTTATKNLLVAGALAFGIAMWGKRFIGEGPATLVAIGVMVVPVKNLIYAASPTSTFLGGGVMAMPGFRRPNGSISAYPRRTLPMGSYPRPGGQSAYPQISSYPSAAYGGHQPG